MESIQNPQAPDNNSALSQGKSGLGGWLVLVGISQVGAVILGIGTIYLSINLFKSGQVAFFTQYIPGFSKTQGFLLGGAVVLLIIYLLSLFFYFRKKKFFPKVFLSTLVLYFIYASINYFLISSLSAPTPGTQNILSNMVANLRLDFFGSIIGGLAWGAYIIKSKRVRNTFIR